MSFINEEEIDRHKWLGSCRILSRPKELHYKIVQICCMANHVALVNEQLVLSIHELSTSFLCREIRDIVFVGRVSHDDSLVFLTAFGTLHYLPMTDDQQYSASEAFLCKLPDIEHISQKENIELQVDYSKSLIVLIIFGEVYCINTNLRSLEANPQTVISVLSIVKYSFSENNSYPLVSKSIKICRYWGKGSTSVLAFATNSEQLELWPIHATKKDDFIEWRRRREKKQPHKRTEKVIYSDAIHTAWVTALSIRAPHHHESNAAIYASGDVTGSVVFWKLEEVYIKPKVTKVQPRNEAEGVTEDSVNAGEGTEMPLSADEIGDGSLDEIPFEHSEEIGGIGHDSDEEIPAAAIESSEEIGVGESLAPEQMESFGSNNIAENSIEQSQENHPKNRSLRIRCIAKLSAIAAGGINNSVTSIVLCADDMFWIGYMSGRIILVKVCYDPVNKIYNLSRLKTISTMLTGGVADIIWRKYSNDFVEEGYKILVSSNRGGQVWEYDLQSTINQVYMLFPQSNPLQYLPQENSKTKSQILHKSNIEACDYCDQLSVLATSCGDGLVSVWDLGTGTLLTVIKVVEIDICKLKVFYDFTDKEEGFSVICGCRDGVVCEYFVGLSTEFVSCRKKSGYQVHTGSIAIANVQDLLMGSVLDSLEDRSIFSKMSEGDSSFVSNYSYSSRVSSELIETFQHSVLAVSDVLLSNSNRNAAFCYGRIYIAIHSREHRRLLLHLQLDNPLESLGFYQDTNLDEATDQMKPPSDELKLVIQSKSGIKIINAVNRYVDADIPLKLAVVDGVETQHCVGAVAFGHTEIAPAPVSTKSVGKGSGKKSINDKKVKVSIGSGAIPRLCVSGIAFVEKFVESEPVSACIFDMEGNLSHSGKAVTVPMFTVSETKYVSPFHSQIIGYNMGFQSSIATVWTMKTANALRVVTDKNKPFGVLRSVTFSIGNGNAAEAKTKSRIIWCKGLKNPVNNKDNRVIILLSDGFCAIVDI